MEGENVIRIMIKKSSITLILLLACILLPVYVSGQTDSTNTGWKVALNAGFFIPSNHSAAFYNGREYNENKISFILKNQYQYNDILSLLEASDTFRLAGLPEKMKYTPTLMVGFSFRNNFRENRAWFIQFNQVKLRAADFYSLEVDPKPFIATDPDYRTFSIIGEENRYLFDLGYSHEFKLRSPMFRPFADVGFSLSNTRVRSHKIRVGEREFSLINIYGSNSYVPNTDLQTFEVIQGGLGYGGFANVGVKLYVNNYISLDPTVHFYLATVKLEGYNQLRPHYFLNIRLSVNNLFLFHENQMGGDKR